MRALLVEFEKLKIGSPKRVRSRRTDWDAFFPYYAGYPLDFASNILSHAGLAKDATILDPWNGSGTTTTAAIGHGFQAVGVDLNPVMAIIGKARSLQPSEADSLVPLAREIVRQSGAVSEPSETEPLEQWFTKDAARAIRSIERIIRTILVGDLVLAGAGGNITSISPIAATFYVALFSICRRAASRFQTSNPTWVRVSTIEAEKSDLSKNALCADFLECVASMANSLQSLFVDSVTDAPTTSFICGDSAIDHVPNGTIDMVLTSPPYCTRIDYTAATRVELAVVWPLTQHDFIDLGRTMIGSTRVPSAGIEPKRRWGPECIKFLQKVRRHPSKASGGYYLRTHLDYFDKLDRSLGCVSHALKLGGGAVFVVQDSYYKEVHNDLATIVGQMAFNRGLYLRRREDFNVPATLAASNPHARKYIRPQGATESVLCFERR